MFGIGDFARHGRVSVRMLRHWLTRVREFPEHRLPRTGERNRDGPPSWVIRPLRRLTRVEA
ncbi:hypothetical protein GB881_01025 [Georgenia subflava]|uniref:MerR family transcriptional regulator n=1 Tax=Georgenia subflava TaxID=1622177 RepID=A0A6N7EK44_9MICO|nr:hypothetical protein [Georgenia subflava]